MSVGKQGPSAAAIAHQLSKFPPTRYMGSKYKLLPFLQETLTSIRFTSALDAFSGSGAVAYLMKAMGKEVTANDYLHFCYHIANSLVANSRARLTNDEIENLCRPNRRASHFVQRSFAGLYFSDEDNRFLDSFLKNLEGLGGPKKRSLALAAAARACIKKRPRGVFTYVGSRYNDGRQDLSLSIKEHFERAVNSLNDAVFSNGRICKAFAQDAESIGGDFDLVYIDPPYVSAASDNDYTRRYHFVEGLVRGWEGLILQQHTQTKKFASPLTAFRNRTEVVEGFSRLFRKHADATIVVSYSSTAIPNPRDMENLLRKFKANVDVVAQEHSYSFGTHAHKKENVANRVREYLFIGR